MNEQAESKRKKRLPESVWILLTALLACLSAGCFRPGTGLLRMLPVPLACMLLCAFFPVRRWQRCALFPALMLALCMVETQDRTVLLLSAVVCVLSLAAAEISALLFRKKRLLPIACGVAVCAVCLAGTSLLIGNPFSALRAKRTIDDYVAKIYDTEAGGFHVSEIGYDCEGFSYFVEMNSDAHITETGRISCKDGRITDGYRRVLEKQYEAEALTALTAAMREAFPDDTFRVIPIGIEGFPKSGEKLSGEYDPDYAGSVRYCIRLSGRTDYEKLKKSALFYSEVFEDAGISCASLVFTGWNSVFARTLAGVVPTGFDGLRYTEVLPVLFTRTFGDRYAVFPFESFGRTAYPGQD